MIRIVSEKFVKPEEKELFFKLCTELAEGSRSEEGNISYTLNADTKDENHYAFIEVWKDEEAVKTHFATEHFTRLVPQIAKCTSKEAPLYIYHEVI